MTVNTAASVRSTVPFHEDAAGGPARDRLKPGKKQQGIPVLSRNRLGGADAKTGMFPGMHIFDHLVGNEIFSAQCCEHLLCEPRFELSDIELREAMKCAGIIDSAVKRYRMSMWMQM